jgi:3-phenylpropionate/trans-cinnamate dioxygenase ferredoxin subunit
MIKPCAISDLVPGAIIRIGPPASPTALAVMKVGGRVFCVDDTCSHETASLSEGWLDGFDLECSATPARLSLP